MVRDTGTRLACASVKKDARRVNEQPINATRLPDLVAPRRRASIRLDRAPTRSLALPLSWTVAIRRRTHHWYTLYWLGKPKRANASYNISERKLQLWRNVCWEARAKEHSTNINVKGVLTKSAYAWASSAVRGKAAGLGSLGRFGWLLKDPPKLELLVVADGGQHLAVWAQARVQHPLFMRFDLRHFIARRMGPDVEQAFAGLGCAEAVCRDDFAVVRRPVQRGDLRPCRDRHGSRVLRRVPEVDVTVAGAASRGQQAQVMGTPSQCLSGKRAKARKSAIASSVDRGLVRFANLP